MNKKELNLVASTNEKPKIVTFNVSWTVTPKTRFWIKTTPMSAPVELIPGQSNNQVLELPMSAREDGLAGFYMYKDTIELLNTFTPTIKIGDLPINMPSFDTVQDAVYPSAYTFYGFVTIPKSDVKIVIS